MSITEWRDINDDSLDCSETELQNRRDVSFLPLDERPLSGNEIYLRSKLSFRKADLGEVALSTYCVEKLPHNLVLPMIQFLPSN
jgi:hypothetical protein